MFPRKSCIYWIVDVLERESTDFWEFVLCIVAGHSIYIRESADMVERESTDFWEFVLYMAAGHSIYTTESTDFWDFVFCQVIAEKFFRQFETEATGKTKIKFVTRYLNPTL